MNFTSEEINSDPILQYFEFAHLPERLQKISEPFCILASGVIREMALRSAERTVGLRKLLEAKDCIVRAALAAKV